MANQKLAVHPIRASTAAETVPNRIRAWVRRLKKRRTTGTIKPPRIWAPATIAAARPAIPNAVSSPV